MKKVILTKGIIRNAVPTIKLAPIIFENASMKTFQKRKSFEQEYKELFRVLLKFPDKEVQQRIIDAINGKENTTSCLYCNSTKKISKNAQTQTEDIYMTYNTEIEYSQVAKTISIGLNNDDVPMPSYIPTTVTKRTTKRRRKIRVPQVIKKSHAEQAKNSILLPTKRPKLNKDSYAAEKASSPIYSGPPSNFSLSIDSLLNITSQFDAVEPRLPIESQIYRIMATEFLRSEHVENSLLPIHIAILDNDLKALQRQIFIWKKVKKVDLNNLLTEDGEDCLQLAIINDCFPKIIEELIHVGLDANSLDVNSNTLLHLAILNTIEIESLNLVIKHINQNVFGIVNDEGYTALHLAIRNGLHLHAELILNTLDSRLLGRITFKRATTDKTDIAEFRKYYENVVDNIEKTCQHFNIGKKLQLKQNLLDANDRKSGYTALQFAVENRLDHFIFFLLAHWANPCIKSHNGQDAKNYLSEFGKTLNLSFKIEKTMDQISQFLEKRCLVSN